MSAISVENPGKIETSVSLIWPGGMYSGKVRPGSSRQFDLKTTGDVQYILRVGKSKKTGNFTVDPHSIYRMTVNYGGSNRVETKELSPPEPAKVITLRGDDLEGFEALSTKDKIEVLETKYKETGDSNVRKALGNLCNNYAVSLEQKDQWEESSRYFTRAGELVPEDELVTRNAITHYNNYANALSVKGEFPDAEHQYLAARNLAQLSSNPLLPEINRNLSIFYTRWAMQDLDNDQLDSAIRLFRKGLDLDPDNYAAWAHLAEVYYERDDLDQAERCYLEAKRCSNIADFDEMIAKIRREKAETSNFTTQERGNFRISFEGEEHKDILRTVQSVLRDAHKKVGRTLHYYPAREIAVIIYTPQKFQRVTQLQAWVGGAFDGKLRIKIDDRLMDEPDQLKKTLEKSIHHEYAHLVISEMAGPQAPVWLQEGLAQYCEPDHTLSTDEKNLLKSWTRRDLMVPLTGLTQPFSDIQEEDSVSRAYLEAESFIAFLIDKYGMVGVRKLLRSIGKGTPLEESVSSAFGVKLSELEKRWIDDLD